MFEVMVKVNDELIVYYDESGEIIREEFWNL